MKFFNEIFDRRMASEGFRALYHRECHICLTTMKLVSAMEADKDAVSGILSFLGLSSSVYEGIRQGERCDPDAVEALCRHLGIALPHEFKQCPGRQKNQKGGEK